MLLVRIALLALCALALSACSASQLHALREARFGPYADTAPLTVAPSARAVSLNAGADGSLPEAELVRLNQLLLAQGPLHRQTLTLEPLTPTGERLAERLGQLLTAQNASVQPVGLGSSTRDALTTDAAAGDLRVVTQAMRVSVPGCAIAQFDQWSVSPFQAVGTLGCANRANLALMVADPRDLARPRTLDNGDGIHAVEAVRRYHEGDVHELPDISFDSD